MTAEEARRRAERRGRERTRSAPPSAPAEPPKQLQGAAAASHAAAVRAAESEREAVERLAALCRTIVKTLARVTGLPGPDALVALVGPADARRVLALTADRELPQPPQVVQHSSARNPYQDDIEHDERYVRAIAQGMPGPQLAGLRRQLAAEQQAARPQRSAVMWQTRSGALAKGTSSMQLPAPSPDYEHLPLGEEG
ncbi:MAG: hypothetical protein JO345_34495 [Streptosporangiaceae bacterium]|nr:hypothetical protein [Streptosporangiaceae bacterium]